MIKAPFGSLDCGKSTFLTAEKMIFKVNANVETIKTYILNLEQKLNSLAADKISIIYSGRFKRKY